MNYTEEPTVFACAGEMLVGILAKPDTPAETGVVVIVGGPQYRIGSHRQFVLLSRALAVAGYAVLRFDYRGMGDSQGEPRDFVSVSTDIATAIGVLLGRVASVKQVALWGLCDGASAALLYYHETSDPRVSGLCLLNPWVRSQITLARTKVKHYYTRRLMQKEFWHKLLSGKVAMTALTGLANNIRLSAASSRQAVTASQRFQERMAIAWHRFPGRILLLLSSEDYVAKEFLEFSGSEAAWRNFLTRPNLLRIDLRGVDHTLSSASSRNLAAKFTVDWLAQQCPDASEERTP